MVSCFILITWTIHIINLLKFNWTIFSSPLMDHVHTLYTMLLKHCYFRTMQMFLLLRIQNTIFTNLVNVTALYYYAEMCGIAISNNLIVQNCIVSDNTQSGNPSLKMFHIVLYDIQCLRLFRSNRLYYFQQYTSVRFKECKFENNSNMTSMIYVSPASSLATTGYFRYEKSTFYNNRNTHFIMQYRQHMATPQLCFD